jgi:adenylate cyclase
MKEATEHRRWTDHEIRAQLERILGHREFQATDRMRDFLRFVVEETLAGRAHQLKGFTIATEVFGRDEDFDAAHDPVVRIQAGRLRRALERYYLVAGGGDPIHIDIPKGAYVPVFSSPETVATAGEPGAGRIVSWPSLLVMPFDNPGQRADLNPIATGLATELGIELANSSDLRVMLFSESLSGPDAGGQQPDFLVRGSIRADGACVKVVAQLVSAVSRELLWSDSIKAPLEDARLIAFQERAAAGIAAHIGAQHGAVYRAVTGITTAQPSECHGSYGAILKGHAYQQTFDPEAYPLALEALTQAHARDGECGLLSSMLAVLYIDNLSLEYFDTTATPLDQAVRLAHEGVRLAPKHELCRLVLARAHLLNDDLAEGLNELEAARALNPDSVLFMDVAGYLFALLGEVERGADMVRKAIALNPFYRVYARYATWLDLLRRGDFDAALEETEWFRGVGFFWAPLARAVTLGHLGRKGEGRAAVERLLGLKPDFPERGPVLIRRLVKSPDLEAQILEGLARSGLSLDEPIRRRA